MAKKEEPTGFKKFVAENKSLLFTIPVFVVLLVIVLFVYVFNGDNTTVDNGELITPSPIEVSTPTPVPSETPDLDGTEVVALPDTIRDKDEEEIYRNPFAVPYRVSGIIYDKNGNSVAIVEAENKSYIVQTGDAAENYFSVVSIDKNEVVILVEDQEISLYLVEN